MAENRFPGQIRRFLMNNCKIANELRKYRDLAGCVNQVSLSGETGLPPARCADYAEYVISENLSCMDMMVANAAYTLLSGGVTTFRARTVARLLTGNPEGRPTAEKQAELEARLQKLAGVRLYILADHDHQVERDLYEGPFLPVGWETAGRRLNFRFTPGAEMPLYQYARDHRHLIGVPLERLRDGQGEHQTQHNNSDQVLQLRHYLLQELEIVLHPKNRRRDSLIRLLKRDQEHNEFGLLWTLGILEGERPVRDPVSAARRVHRTIGQLMDNWRQSGYLREDQYRMLSRKEGFGVLLLAGETDGEAPEGDAETPPED